MGSGTIGFGLPAAIGAKFAKPRTQVIAICGDGGFMFSCQELATAIKYNLNIPILVFNDNCYGIIKHVQLKKFGRQIDVDLTNPNLIKFAESFGAVGVRLNSLKDLKPALMKALSAERTTLIEIPFEISKSLRPPALF